VVEVQCETVHRQSNFKGPENRTTNETNEKHSAQQDPTKHLFKTEQIQVRQSIKQKSDHVSGSLNKKPCSSSASAQWDQPQ